MMLEIFGMIMVEELDFQLEVNMLIKMMVVQLHVAM
jgi:hypothetical protein